MLSILLARLAEVEAPVVAGEGAHAGDHHLPERGVDVEEEGPVEIPDQSEQSINSIDQSELRYQLANLPKWASSQLTWSVSLTRYSRVPGTNSQRTFDTARIYLVSPLSPSEILSTKY